MHTKKLGKKQKAEIGDGAKEDDLANELSSKMEQALTEDHESNRNKKPALERFKLLKELELSLRKN